MRPLLLAPFLAAFASIAAPYASAADFSRPNVIFQELHPYLCFERLGSAKLSLFGCDDDVSADPFILGRAVEENRRTLFPSRPAYAAHAASRFARLAGKFMGRVDAATLGSFRFRFVVILE